MPHPGQDTHGGCRIQADFARSGLVLGAILALFVIAGSAASRAQEPAAETTPTPTPTSTSTPIDEFARRLQRLEEQNAQLAEQNRALSRQLEQVTDQYGTLQERLERLDPPTGLPALVMPESELPVSPMRPNEPETPPTPPARPEPARFLVGERDEEGGQYILVRPRDEDRVPFELRADFFTQARYFGFSRSADQWIDSTGAAQPIRNYNSLEINRNFIQFSGFAIDPRLQYTAILFSSTSINDTVYLGWINYRFSKAFDLRVGNWIVPGTREWYESFRYTMGADRLMATTFFRPNISPGIWAQGEPLDNVYYVAMLANSFNRFTQGIERIGSGFVFGGTAWWEPRGAFGLGPSDIENHQQLTPRIGTNLGLTREVNQAIIAGAGMLRNPEDTILRLSDGTPLFRPGALGPGVELSSTALQLWTIDAALKYRGLGVSGEYFLRWLDGFHAVDGPAPRNTIFDQGGLLQAGYFVIPRTLEGYARTSFVTGPFGSGYEVGGGLNWYVRQSRDWRLTFEVLNINHSPAQNILTGYRAGESGTLFQLQWFTDF